MKMFIFFISCQFLFSSGASREKTKKMGRADEDAEIVQIDSLCAKIPYDIKKSASVTLKYVCEICDQKFSIMGNYFFHKKLCRV